MPSEANSLLPYVTSQTLEYANCIVTVPTEGSSLPDAYVPVALSFLWGAFCGTTSHGTAWGKLSDSSRRADGALSAEGVIS